MLKFSKKSLGVVAAIAAQAVLASSVSAAVGTGALVITGSFPAYNAVSVTQEDFGTTRLNLTTIFGAYVKVGQVRVGSNDADGFTLSVQSDGTFQMRNEGAYAADDAASFLGYTFRLAASSGALGANVTAPTLTGLSDGSGTKVLSFGSAAHNATPTTILYDVSIQSTSVKALIAGDYTDTLTFSIAGIN